MREWRVSFSKARALRMAVLACVWFVPVAAAARIAPTARLTTWVAACVLISGAAMSIAAVGPWVCGAPFRRAALLDGARVVMMIALAAFWAWFMKDVPPLREAGDLLTIAVAAGLVSGVSRDTRGV